MKNISLTKGRPLPTIIRFALPLMFGDLFQQLYNAVDSAMVGNYAGHGALAAVSSSTFLIRLIVGLFVGISAGASVVLSQSVGAGNLNKSKKLIHTMAALTLLLGLILTVFSIAIAKPLLYAVSTPHDVMDDAVMYLRTYFSGALFSLIYNIGSGILCSFGDSKRPFFYLATSSVTNILLDYLFIRTFKLGAFGAGLATMIAQLVSALFIVAHLVTTKAPYSLYIKEIHIDRTLVPEILQMGLPAGLQNTVVAFSNVLIQSQINAAGTAAMAGFGIFNKVDSLVMLPLSSIAMALTTYTGQNFGARNKDRLKAGLKAMLLLQFATWMIGSTIFYTFGRSIFSLFTDDEPTIQYTLMVMRYLTPCYWALGIGYSMTCMLRGAGKSHAASLLFIFSMCIARQAWILITNHMGLGISGVLASYPFSWIMTIVLTVLYVVYLNKRSDFCNMERNVI